MLMIAKSDNQKARMVMSYPAVVQGCLETLEQAQQFLLDIEDRHYVTPAAPYVSSSIGEHFRHWLDIFHAIRLASEEIDYNQRRRGHAVEHSIEQAQVEIAQLTTWLGNLSAEAAVMKVSVTSEVTLYQTRIAEMQSTLERELAFAALHANHHFAMAKVAAQVMQVETNSAFGIAPATATYIRGE
ncbi:TPA: hypothetical protein ACGUVZ_004657 [Vibrio vulnificus]|nr:hypothetical protein [Vibrio vulnificus]MCU8201498.1 hypothetical protein [Vibrio vulnificus]HAS8522043.1 hypothetical protein [Vibrio vulnificus]